MSPSAQDRPSSCVDRWFARNTFDAREFSDREALLALKRTRGVTISLGLPALNEAATIVREIEILRRTLMAEVPLLDEIVVIDGGSGDGTAALARRQGIPTYHHAEILPDQGAYAGKGEALWKSLHVLKGDLVAWVDTDIRNMHPKFIYGLLGPLLRDPSIGSAAAVRRSPLRSGAIAWGRVSRANDPSISGEVRSGGRNHPDAERSDSGLVNGSGSSSGSRSSPGTGSRSGS